MTPQTRLVLVLGGVTVVLALLVLRRVRDRQVDPAGLPAMPRDVVAEGRAAWVVFTTPYCASCGPVSDALGETDPARALIRVDVAERPDLARRYHVRTAPTAARVEADGEVSLLLVGAPRIWGFVSREPATANG